MAARELLGREHPLMALRAELDRVSTSHGGLVLIAGEAGIGKTTLVADVFNDVRDGRAVLASGTAWDRPGAPDYWPWTQVLRGLEREATGEEWSAGAAAAGSGLRFLLGGAEPPRPDLTDAVIFQLHDAVVTLLVTISRSRPVVIVLDDLHWADAASITLLEFVMRHAWFERILVVGTYRDVEVAALDHPLRPSLSALATKATTLTLTGLDTEQVGTLIARATGRQPDEALVAEVHRRTGGNPFFVEQVASLWHSGGSIESIPPGLRETLGARLAQLPSAVVDVLATAAVIGREFDAGVLAGASGIPDRELETVLDQVVAARLVVRVGAERLAFVHDLIRDTLAAGLDAGELQRRHAAVVEALERRGSASSAELAGDLAHHADLAGPEVEAERTIRYLLTAADDACRRLAADEVTRHYRGALERIPVDQQRRRADLALDLGVAQRWAGDLAGARVTFDDLVDVGRRLGDAEVFARAALGLHDLGLADPDEDWQREIELLDEAQDRLVEADVPEADPLRVYATAAALRARAHLATPGTEGLQASSEEVLGRARRCGDDGVLGFALLAHHDAVWRPGTAPERVALAEEMTAVARRTQDLELELQAAVLRLVGLLELGDPRSLEEFDRFVALAERSRLPRFVFLARSRQAAMDTLQGRFDDALVAVDAALRLGEQLDEVDRTRLWHEQRWALSVLQGDLEEAERLLREHHGSGYGVAPLPEVVTAAARGDAALPHRHAAEIARLADEAPRMFQPAYIHAQAQIAIATGDEGHGDTARAMLEPLRNLWAVVAGGGSNYGPYAYWLAWIDAVQRRWDDAIAGFEVAIERAEQLRARPWSVHARLGLALALRDRGGRGDHPAASQHLDRVVQEARRLDMESVAARALDAQAELARLEAEQAPVAEASRLDVDGPEPQPSNDAAPASSTAPNDGSVPVFRREGKVWTLGYGGRIERLPDAKGLRDLHYLLGRPGIEVPAVELLDPAGGEVVRRSKQFGGDPVLDEEARRAYRERLTQLDEQIDRAGLRNDDDAAARLDRERAALLEELRAATGLGGRRRRLGDEAERARKTVTARIRDTFRRLDEAHPELAEHLRASVSTGASCTYRPQREVRWHL